MDNANGVADHMRSMFERKRKENEDMLHFNKKIMDQLIEIQTVNDELTIINRTLQSELKEKEPSVPIPKLEPEQGSIARGVVERGPRGKGVEQLSVTQGTNRKRKDVGISDFASLNVHQARRTRRGVTSKSENLIRDSIGNQSKPVEIDECTEEVDKAKTGSSYRQFNINKTAIGKQLDGGTKLKLQNILTDKSPGYELILLDIVSLSVKDMEDILGNKSLSSNVIDTYAKILKSGGVVEKGDSVNPIILTTLAWQYILLGREIGINKFLLDPILDNIHRATHIMIPLHHATKYHFTLMYLDKTKGVWYHVNPIKPRRKGGEHDKCYHDASRMHCEIRRFLMQMKENAPRTLMEGTREHFSTKGNGKSKQRQVLTENERNAIQWLVDSDVDYPLEAKTDCPHQSTDSVDCAVAVMYYMTEIFAGRALDATLKSSVIRNMRVRVAEVFTDSMVEALNVDPNIGQSSNCGISERLSEGGEKV